MKFLFTSLTICMGSFFPTSFVIAQNTEFVGEVNVKSDSEVFKRVIVPGCPTSYTPPLGTTGTTITYETKYSNGKTEIVIQDEIKPSSTPIIIESDKELKITLLPADGKANLYTNDKDKTKLFVNYFLNDFTRLEKGTEIQKQTVKFDCNGTITFVASTKEKLQDAETFYLWRVEPTSGDYSSSWFANSDRIDVFDSNGNIDYYLVNRYDRDAKYELVLGNREPIVYKSSSLDFGTLTIPFKFRPGFNKNDIKVKGDVVANFNIGVYGGLKISKNSIINKAGSYTERNHFTTRVGPFLSLSTVTLDSLNTNVGSVPFKKDEKQNIGILSGGVGLMVSSKGLQFGIYVGWDFGLGSEAKSWNYDKKPWFGIGIGYKLTDLFARKE